jgi:hypothetical protein
MMNKEIKTLTEKFIRAAEKSHFCLKRKKLKKSFDAREDAERIFYKIHDLGSEGMLAIIRIAEGNSYPAAILSCILAYPMIPNRCVENLKRIVDKNDPAFSFLANWTLDILETDYGSASGVRELVIEAAGACDARRG